MQKTFILCVSLFLISCFTPKQLELKRITVRDSIPIIGDGIMPLYETPYLRKMYPFLAEGKDENPYFFVEKLTLTDSSCIPYPLSFWLSRVMYAVSPVLPKKKFTDAFYWKVNQKIDNQNWIWYFSKEMRRIHTKGKYLDRKKTKKRYPSPGIHPRIITYPCCFQRHFSDYFRGKYINQICSQYIEMPKYQVIMKYKYYTDTVYVSDDSIRPNIRMLYHNRFYEGNIESYRIIRSLLDSVQMN